MRVTYPCELFSSNFSDPGCDVDLDAGKLDSNPPDRLPLPSVFIGPVPAADKLDESPIAPPLDGAPPLAAAASTSCSRCCLRRFLLHNS